MIPLFGIGLTPAVVALFLYALLPIIRNTYAGILSVDATLIEAGKSMGMKKNQRLVYLELPLSVKTIMAGIRTATVINIGTATLAAFIGAGGLGELIITGISLNNNGMILQGALPAALLAIALDYLLMQLERRLTPRGMKKAPSK
jgi:osmoprotectant transport system permease protein